MQYFVYTKQMKTILTITIYLLFIVIVIPVAAQKKKSFSGYIITQTNDTVSCEFEPFNWKKQPVLIKARIDGHDTVFRPGEINGFMNSSGSEFVSRKIELFKYNNEIQTATPDDVPWSKIIPAAFLKVLYRGKAVLYFYKDVLGYDHYFIEKNSILKEIYVHLYYTGGGHGISPKNPNKKPVVVNYFQYYYGLKEIMQDCKDIFPEIDKTEYTTRSIISLLKKYDKCPPVSGN